MSDARQRIGTQGEDLAVQELERQGMTVVERNWRCRLGEIDIIAREPTPKGSTLVFCEVKCRTGLGFGDPLEAITWAKIRRLRQLAGEWMATHGAAATAVRIDAIAVIMLPGQAPSLRHVRAVEA